MRKFLKSLSFVMSAVVSLAAVPMISAENSSVNANENVDYCMDSYNYAWVRTGSRGELIAYKDGSILNFWDKQYKLCLKTGEGAELTAESLGLPEGMEVERRTADDYQTITEKDADYFIYADSDEEIIQLAGMSEDWIDSGIVTEVLVHRVFGYGCMIKLYIDITLKEPDESFDPNSFEGLEDIAFEKKSDTLYSMDYHNQSLDVLTAPEIIDNVQADERVESVDLGFSSCLVAHYVYNDIPADEYFKKYDTTVIPSNVSDAEKFLEENGNVKVIGKRAIVVTEGVGSEISLNEVSAEGAKVPEKIYDETLDNDINVAVYLLSENGDYSLDLERISGNQLLSVYRYNFSVSEGNDAEIKSAAVRNSGDVNNDGKIGDLYDVIDIAKYVMEITDFDEETLKIADINGDGAVDLYDAIEIAKMLI